MKINSIEVQTVCNVTHRVESYAKTTFKVKPTVAVGALIYEHRAVVENLQEKLVNSKHETYHILVRTSQGQFRWTVKGYRV